MEGQEDLKRGDIAVVADPNRPQDTWKMIAMEDQSGEKVVLANEETLWPEPMKRLSDDPKLLWTGMRYLVVIDVLAGEATSVLESLADVA